MPIVNRDIPLVLQRWLDCNLAEGEELLWSGQSKADLYGKLGTGYCVLIVCCTVITAALEYGALKLTLGINPPATLNYIDLLFQPFILLFALVGFVVVLIPFRSKQWARQRVYAVTSKRVLIAWQVKGGGIAHRSIEVPQLSGRTCACGSTGIGTLTFNGVPSKPIITRYRVLPNKPAFQCVPDVQMIDDLITSTFHISSADPPGAALSVVEAGSLRGML